MLIVFLTDDTEQQRLRLVHMTHVVNSNQQRSPAMLITSEKQQLNKVSRQFTSFYMSFWCELRAFFSQIISAFLHDKKISWLLPCRRINRAPPLPENTMSHREHFPSLMTSISIHSNIKHPNRNLATVMLHQVFFFSPLSTSTEITQPEKSAQNDILCTSARCQSAHLPLRHKKALFSPAGLVDTRIIESNCPIFVAAGESVYETQPGGWKGERKHKSTCTHGCQKRKSRVRMCHFKEGWWAGRSSQAGGEELAEQVWRLQRSQLLFCLAAVQRSWQIKLKLNHSKCELLQ